MSICEILKDILEAILSQSSPDTELICGQPVGGGAAFTVLVTIDNGTVTFADTQGNPLVEGVDFERCPGNQEIVDAINGLAACICCPDEMAVGFAISPDSLQEVTKWNINGSDTDADGDTGSTPWTLADLATSLNANDPLGGTWAVNTAGDAVILTSPDPGTYIHLKLVSLVPVVTIPFGSVTQ